MAATGICTFWSTVRREPRVKDLSGQQPPSATLLVRQTLQIWFRSWIQKSPKCKREGATGVDDEVTSIEETNE